MVHESTYGPDTGTFDTKELEQSSKAQANSRNIKLAPGQYESFPQFALGYNLIECNTREGDNIRLRTSIEKAEEGFRVDISTWNVSTLERARVNWAECREGAKDVQMGTWEPNRYGWKEAQKSRVEFKTKFKEPPTVVCWLQDLDMRWADSWRINAFPSDVDGTGFTCNAETWSGSSIYRVRVNWIAIKKGKKNFHAGNFTNPASRGKPQSNKISVIQFPSGKFKNPPVVLTGFNALDQPTPGNLKVESRVANVSEGGFTWYLDHDSKWTNNASYIAIGQD